MMKKDPISFELTKIHNAKLTIGTRQTSLPIAELRCSTWNCYAVNPVLGERTAGTYEPWKMEITWEDGSTIERLHRTYGEYLYSKELVLTLNAVASGDKVESRFTFTKLAFEPSWMLINRAKFDSYKRELVDTDVVP